MAAPGATPESDRWAPGGSSSDIRHIVSDRVPEISAVLLQLDEPRNFFTVYRFNISIRERGMTSF